MKTKSVSLIVCFLALGVLLCGCASDKFPTGSFRHELVTKLILEVNRDGTWAYKVGREVISSGTYTILDNEFIVETDTVHDAIDSNMATYEWSYQNDILTLKLKGDGNPPERFYNLDSYPLVRYRAPLSSMDI